MLIKAQSTVRKDDLHDEAEWLRQHVPAFAAGDHDAIVAELKQILLDAFRAAAPDVPVDTTVVDLAGDWALEHATDVEALLSESTQNMVRELVSAAVKDGLSPQQLRAALQDAAAFSRNRAETIARTETATALGQGQRAAAIAMSQDEKSWIPGNCDICTTNADAGWIGIDEAFPSGDDTIPGHPRCTCTVIYRTKRVHEDDGEDDGEEKALRPRLVTEAHCPHCGRWVGRNVNVGATVYCPKCKGVAVRG